MGSQVVLYVDQRRRVKQKSDNLRTNWLDVSFNLTKNMTRFLLSYQFQNIELDNKSCSLEHHYLCFYVWHLYTGSYILGFEIDIMMNFDLWTWNFTLHGLMYTI